MRWLVLAAVAVASAAVAPGVKAAGLTVDQAGQQFSEKTVSLSAGDEVIFTNHDEAAHNISIIDADDGNENLGLQKPGKSISFTFSKHGKFKVRCSIHPGMKMTVNVQ